MASSSDDEGILSPESILHGPMEDKEVASSSLLVADPVTPATAPATTNCENNSSGGCDKLPGNTSGGGAVPSVAVDPRTSFTADSPYFRAFVDQEVNNLQTLAATLQDISDKTRTFTKTGKLMSEAMRRLSSSCKLRQPIEENDDENTDPTQVMQHRRQAVGEEMTNLLDLLGDVSQRKGS